MGILVVVGLSSHERAAGTYPSECRAGVCPSTAPTSPQGYDFLRSARPGFTIE
jgi:hypothetical protein